MPAPTKSPVERCNADGAVNAVTLNQGNHVFDSTPFPLSTQAGHHAAQLWLSATTPPASMADWRDNRFHAHAAGLNFPNYHDRQQAFNDAYAGRIAQAIVGKGAV